MDLHRQARSAGSRTARRDRRRAPPSPRSLLTALDLVNAGHAPAAASTARLTTRFVTDRLVARAADHPQPVERWIRAVLPDASRTNAGQRLTRPAALGVWLETALALRPPARWHADAVLPPGLADLPEAWADRQPADPPLRRRQSVAGAGVVLRLRLRHAAHLAAIFLRCRT